MFSGIVEQTGKVVKIEREGTNINISLTCSFVNELKIDQSLAHNGVCLTVVDIKDDYYTVTAVQETLDKTNLGYLKVGDEGNITVEKGSVSVNGVSLTVVNSQKKSFQVAIIPFTYEVTNFHNIEKGTVVNLEFDIVGKYIQKIMNQYLESMDKK